MVTSIQRKARPVTAVATELEPPAPGLKALLQNLRHHAPSGRRGKSKTRSLQFLIVPKCLLRTFVVSEAKN